MTSYCIRYCSIPLSCRCCAEGLGGWGVACASPATREAGGFVMVEPQRQPPTCVRYLRNSERRLVSSDEENVEGLALRHPPRRQREQKRKGYDRQLAVLSVHQHQSRSFRWATTTTTTISLPPRLLVSHGILAIPSPSSVSCAFPLVVHQPLVVRPSHVSTCLSL